jgi:hypothetical protein
MGVQKSSSTLFPSAMGYPTPGESGNMADQRRILEIQDNLSAMLSLVEGLRRELDAMNAAIDEPKKPPRLPRIEAGTGIEVARKGKHIRISLATLSAAVTVGKIKSLVEGQSYLIDLYADGVEESPTYRDTEALVVNAIDGQELAADTLVFVYGTFGASFQCYTASDGSGASIPAKITAGGPGDTYTGDLYANGKAAAATESGVSIVILQIDAAATIPANTWLFVSRVGDHYEGQVAVWL